MGSEDRRVYSTFQEFEKQRVELGIELPYSNNTKILSTPLKIGEHTAPNRLVCQAMEGCDGRRDGAPDELTERRYMRLAKGGAGIISEAKT